MTKEPEAQRQKLESSASCCSGAQSTAGLLLEHRRLDQQDAQQEDADDGVSLGPGCPVAGATPNSDDLLAKDDSDLEKVGSDTTGSDDS